MKVPLLDLKLQYQSVKKEIVSSINEIMDNQQFILGQNVVKIEEKIAQYCGTKHAIGVNSGSDALLLSLMATGIKPGDMVVTTPYTFFATVGSICRLGAFPLLIDIDPTTYNINPEQLCTVLDSLTDKKKEKVKAIIPVHLFGQCADMKPIMQVATQNNLTVIEDAAQALGASCTMNGQVKKACSIGDCGCLSFFPSKNLGCFGDGGMVLTDNDEKAGVLRSLRMHGEDKKYHHRYIGINGRLDAIQAAVLLVKFPHIDLWAEKRVRNATYYKKLFKENNLLEHVTLPSTLQGSFHVFNQFIIRASMRDDLKKHLEQNGVGCAIYYPLPLHLQKCFDYLGCKTGDFPESEKAAQETIALPVFPELEKKQLEYVVEQISNFYRNIKT